MPKCFHIKAEICDFSITGLPCIHRKYHFERMSMGYCIKVSQYNAQPTAVITVKSTHIADVAAI